MARRCYRARSPHLRKVVTRLLFLSCFGVGDFSVLHGRHALASPRPEPDLTLLGQTPRPDSSPPASHAATSPP